MKNYNPTELLKIRTSDDFDVIDVVPIPMHGDRMIRLRTLEEALNDFDQSGDDMEAMGYFVQVKPRRAGSSSLPVTPAPHEPSVSSTNAGSAEGIYLATGKLNVPQLIRSADLLRESGDYALARNIYKAIIQSGEKSSIGLMGLAQCYEAEGKLEEARINYEESIAYHPQPEAYKALTSLLIRQKKDQQAAEVIDRALHNRKLEGPHRYELHKTAGNCWSRMNNLREAERHYKKALEIQPNADEIRTNLGALCLQAGKIRDAERHFQDALAANPTSYQALTGLGSCALAEDNKPAAHAWFARSLQIELKNPTAIFHLVKCAYAIKNYSVAAQILENYIQVAPINTNLLYSLAGLQFHLNRMTDVRATCFKILQLAPEHAGAQELINRTEGRIERTSPGR